MGRYTRRSGRQRGGLPGWLVFLSAVALVFGMFYLWDGFQRFIRTGGLGVAESTARAAFVASATAERVTRVGIITRTPPPTPTALPECQAFRVSVVNAPTALVRAAPNMSARVVGAFPNETDVCVLWREPNSEYYAVDSDPTTRRYEIAYMHESVLEARFPTPTASATVTLPPSVTPPATLTPSPSVTGAPPATFTPSATVYSPQPTLPPVATPTEGT
jgi:hypothetical protein